jgi:hypothetical protein
MTIEILRILIYGRLIFGAVAIQATYSGLIAGPALGFSNHQGNPPGIGAAPWRRVSFGLCDGR